MFFVYGTAVTIGGGLTPFLMALHTIAGGMLGAILGLGLDYTVYLINGQSYDASTTKVRSRVADVHSCTHEQPTALNLPSPMQAAAAMCLSGVSIFMLFCMRFRFRDQDLIWRTSSVTLALMVAGTYSTRIGSPLEFFVHDTYFIVIASVVTALSRTVVVPVTCCEVVRSLSADAMHALGTCVQQTIAVMTAEVRPDGKLAGSSGVNELGMDQGLWEAGVQGIHQAATEASNALAVSAC